MGPRSIFTSLFTPSIYFHSLLSFALLSLALILCKQQGRRNLQLLCTRWEQSYLLLCAGPRQLLSPKKTSGAVVTFLYLFESYWRQTLVSSPREICYYLHPTFHLG